MLTPLILCSCSCKLWIHSTQTIHSQCSDNHDSFNAAAYTYRYIIYFSHLIGVRSLSSAVLAQFWRDLKTHLFEWHCISFSALAVFSRNALYKSTFYLLTYLLTYLFTLCRVDIQHFSLRSHHQTSSSVTLHSLCMSICLSICPACLCPWIESETRSS